MATLYVCDITLYMSDDLLFNPLAKSYRGSTFYNTPPLSNGLYLCTTAFTLMLGNSVVFPLQIISYHITNSYIYPILLYLVVLDKIG